MPSFGPDDGLTTGCCRRMSALGRPFASDPARHSEKGSKRNLESGKERLREAWGGWIRFQKGQAF